jgi:hypothetical protein
LFCLLNKNEINKNIDLVVRIINMIFFEKGIYNFWRIALFFYSSCPRFLWCRFQLCYKINTYVDNLFTTFAKELSNIVYATHSKILRKIDNLQISRVNFTYFGKLNNWITTQIQKDQFRNIHFPKWVNSSQSIVPQKQLFKILHFGLLKWLEWLDIISS